MRNVYDLMKYRRTTREFDTKNIEVDKLKRIVQAGIYAPSGSNSCPYLIYQITNPQIKAKIRKGAEVVEKSFYDRKQLEDPDFIDWAKTKNLSHEKPMITQAPVLFVIVEDTNYDSKHSLESCWIMIGYLLIAIESEGLNSVTYTPEDLSFIKDILQLSQKLNPLIIIPIGYSLTNQLTEPKRPDIKDRLLLIQ
ncbi:MAG: nitroreductase family protein [Candidatus Heimdallarchaeota archaeon]|nr:nitroreductase family protein [Candidatus Heimdallarchaeota archaeon]